MDHVTWTAFTFCMTAVCSTRGCVFTAPELRVVEGVDVHLSCNFSRCPGPLDHTIHVNWQFNNTTVNEMQDFLYYYGNQSVTIWANAESEGNILVGDFSCILRSVTPKLTGTYHCSLRPLHKGVIYKSYTRLIVDPSPSGRKLDPAKGPDPAVPGPPWLVPVCCGAGLLCLAAGGVLAAWARRRRPRLQQARQREDQGKPPPTEETQHSHKDQSQGTDCYVTLQRCKVPPPPSSKGESIYITMHGHAVPPGLPAQSHHSRKGIPKEWCTQESPTLTDDDSPSPYCMS
ncbi:hypothetical protein MATL_G00117880 [Megalops atlanticus]|uniref:Immunoglobulin domain-containing protein n=1 Tax=Megalops atlanticus TaxID=7932 RepID=A0A9D3PY30_MEGAT|nr:hypothetical protein MATL_G00117880 [Megalops atlanticus]